MLHNLEQARLRAMALSLLLLIPIGARLAAQQQTSSSEDTWGRRPRSRFFVLNSPSTASQGSDSILAFDALGHSSVFFSASHDLQGLDDIACSSNGPHRLIVSHNNDSEGVSELLELDGHGKIVGRTPFGSADGAGIALAFDDVGNFYAAQGTAVYKNGALFTNLLPTGSEMGKMVVDRQGRIYITQPVTSKVVRVDALGSVTVFADATQGVNSPYGLAVDGKDNIYVVSNPPSAPAFIQKFDPAGVASSFATDISFQPNIRGLMFDLDRDGQVNQRDPDLYAALGAENQILKFDGAGHSDLFADATDGLDFPISIGSCRQGW